MIEEDEETYNNTNTSWICEKNIEEDKSHKEIIVT